MTEYIDNIRKQFPILHRKVYGKDLVYLDNAATIQRPQSVIDMWNEITDSANSNIHRAVHYLADVTTRAYEASRDCVKDFLNAESREEIVFTSGATASINLVAYSFGEAFVGKGDEVIIGADGHHSNIVPWQLMCERKGAILRVLPIDETGHLCVEQLEQMITDKTKIVAVTHISNVLGLINPVEKVISIAHAHNVPVLVDGAQGIVHEKVDVQVMDCDFYVFSGHKIYAATGTGVLYGKKRWLDAMPPYMGGGEMIGRVTFEKTTYAPLPMKFEAGTQNFASVATMKPALEFAQSLRNAEIDANEVAIRDYMLDALMSDSRITLYGIPGEDRSEKIPLFSFCVEGVHHEDLALILDKMGVAVRSGQMCAEPIMDRYGVTGMLRASFAKYNTLDEAKYFIKSLNRAIDMLL